jgi:methionyl-tRNA formyltransferase
MSDPAAQRFIVAGSRPWNRRTFDRELKELPGDWTFVTTPDTLALALERPSPRFVFFLHWSWIVPSEVVAQHECVVFHMTQVPYGRGGSPLQNLISRGHDRTVLSALRMTDEVDAGPVYMQEDLSLDGTAESVYLRADRLAAAMIQRIITTHPEPAEQAGDPVVFPRRRPSESMVSKDLEDLDRLIDHIRMLDAEDYPHAYIDYGSLRLTFRRAARYEGRVSADVTITLRVDEA